MRNLICVLMLTMICAAVQGQGNRSVRKGHTLGLSFTQHDFKTAAELKVLSLSEIMQRGTAFQMARMDPGLALTYSSGISDLVDVTVRLGYGVVDYIRANASGTNGINSQALLESDVTFNAKLVSEAYWVSPYVTAGVGASKWGVYYGAYAPVGVGLQVNFANQYLVLQSQYRLPVSGHTNHHVFYSIGFATALGKK